MRLIVNGQIEEEDVLLAEDIPAKVMTTHGQVKIEKNCNGYNAEMRPFISKHGRVFLGEAENFYGSPQELVNLLNGAFANLLGVAPRG